MTGEQEVWSDFGGWLFGSILIFLCWVAFYHGIKYYQLLQSEHRSLLKLTSDKQREQLRRLQAETVAREAQLKMLRYQLNPHFLFNTLNAISALVTVKQSVKANDVIVQLSNFLRYSLDNDPVQMVTVEEEINAVRLYLDIEQTRFGERLALEFAISPECGEVKVPSLILQPLVENSIKHAIAPSETGGKISVLASLQGRFLIVDVVDTGPGMDIHRSQNKRVGIGLKNTAERLKEFYNEDYELQMENCSAGGLLVRLKVPADKTTD